MSLAFRRFASASRQSRFKPTNQRRVMLHCSSITSLRSLVTPSKSDPVSLDTKLARMTVTMEAGHGDEAEEVSDTPGAV